MSVLVKIVFAKVSCKTCNLQIKKCGKSAVFIFPHFFRTFLVKKQAKLFG